MEFLFWLGVGVVLYTYLGYGILTFILVRLRGGHKKKWPVLRDEDLPEVTHLIAAYNEEDWIADKIRNSLEADYPKDKLKVLVITDGADDRTPEIVAEFPEVTHMHRPERRGKIAAVKRALPTVKSPITIFSDANAMLNKEAVRRMVNHFQRTEIGAVAGEKRVIDPSNQGTSGEGLYWKYESFLKTLDTQLHTVVGAAGELFATRTHLFPIVPDDTIIEDFYATLTICQKGYRVAYEPTAYAMESSSASVGEELKRKVRICAGGFQAISRLRELLNPFRYGWLTYQYVSHRVLRWTLAPLFLPIILITNIVLAAQGLALYQWILAAQIGFYLLAGAGYLLQNRTIPIKGFFVPFYFTMMNISVYLGFRRFLNNSQSVVWERAQRSSRSVAQG